MADFYEVLGVPKDADEAAIKKAFRRKAKDAHPDRQGGDARAMVAINRAYQVLSDPEKRQYYDAHGSDPPISEPEQTARSMLYSAVMAALGAEQEVPDLVRATQMVFQHIRHEQNKQIVKAKKVKERIERHRKRLHTKKERNDIEQLFNEQTVAIEEALQKGARQLQAITDAEKLLKDYTYDPDIATFGGISTNALAAMFAEQMRKTL